MIRHIANRTARTRTAWPASPPRPGTVVRPRMAAALLAVGLAAGSASYAGAQAAPSEADRITVEWVGVPIEDVLGSFAEYSGLSMVAGPEVTGFVTAYIADRPWDVALRAILAAHGLMAVEDEHGILHVTTVATADAAQAEEPIVTRTYRVSFVPAAELVSTLAPHLSERGTISVAESTNSLVISDTPSIHQMIAGLLRNSS